MTKKELDSLRHEVDRIDKELVRLLSRRADVAREIGLTKRRDGLKVRDVQRERKVVDRMVKAADSLGLDSRLAKEVSKLLIAHAVKVQKGPVPSTLEGMSALVVGGSGKMGGWFCRFLSNRGASVKVWDPRGRARGYSNVRLLEPAARSADIVVLASPLGTCCDELRMIISSRPEGLVIVICSVKSHIAGLLRHGAADGLRMASAHPMFGPGAPTPRGLNVIVCDCGNREATRQTGGIFKDAGAEVVELYLEEHDRVMAFVLGLPHISALAFSNALRASGRKTSQLKGLGGTSFARLAELSREVSGESRRAYHDIQALNPNTREMFEALETVLSELKAASLRPEHEDFIRLMDLAKENMEE